VRHPPRALLPVALRRDGVPLVFVRFCSREEEGMVWGGKGSGACSVLCPLLERALLGREWWEGGKCVGGVRVCVKRRRYIDGESSRRRTYIHTHSSVDRSRRDRGLRGGERGEGCTYVLVAR
jgi:hypothetical protein